MLTNSINQTFTNCEQYTFLYLLPSLIQNSKLHNYKTEISDIDLMFQIYGVIVMCRTSCLLVRAFRQVPGINAELTVYQAQILKKNCFPCTLPLHRLLGYKVQFMINYIICYYYFIFVSYKSYSAILESLHESEMQTFDPHALKNVFDVILHVQVL